MIVMWSFSALLMGVYGPVFCQISGVSSTTKSTSIKSHEFNVAGGFAMGLVSDPPKNDKDGKLLHSEHCKGSSCAKTADSRASSRIRTRVNNGLMPSISVDQLAERRKDNKGREYVQSPFHDEWLEIFKKKVDGVVKSVTKKPESVRKIQLGGRPKREMFKQLPVLESEVVGKKEDDVSKEVRI